MSVPETQSEVWIGNTFWLKHCRSWFAFAEPAQVQQDPDGANFVAKATGKPLRSLAQNGFTYPSKDVLS